MYVRTLPTGSGTRPSSCPARRRTSTSPLPGAELTAGQTAEVLTRLPQGPTLYWEITALCAHRSELVEGLLEVPYEITFLGAGDDGNPVIQPAVAVPVLTAAESAESADSADSADSVDSAEGADAAAEVPSHVEELVEGTTYRGTVVTGVRPGCGVGTTAICFEFQAQGGRPGPVARRDRAVALIGICPENFRVLCMR